MSRAACRGWRAALLAGTLLLGACAPAGGTPGRDAAPPAPTGAQPAAAAPAATPPAPQKFIMGLASVSPQNANIQTMHDAGIFQEHGLEAELQYTGGGANSIAPLVSGQIPIMIGGIPAYVLAQLGGAEVKIVAVQNDRFDYFFVATPDIQRPDDLRGKTVSGTRRGALADTSMDFLLRYWGLEPFKDVNIVHVNGGESVRAAALVNGAAVGTVMVAPLPPEFSPPRWNVLANMSELDIPFASNGLAAPSAQLASDPAFYDRFLRAYLQGNEYFRTHPEEGARGVINLLKRDDIEYGRAAQAYYARLLPAVPTTTPASMQAVLDTLVDQHPAAATTPPAELLDMRPLERIIASGYLDQLRQQ